MALGFRVEVCGFTAEGVGFGSKVSVLGQVPYEYVA